MDCVTSNALLLDEYAWEGEGRMKLLEIKGLHTSFYTSRGIVRAVSGVDLYVEEGETLGIVGESGCGKSVTSLSILRLIPKRLGKIEQGEILFKGQDLLEKSEKEMRAIRGKGISMIFQEPMTSLNPSFTIGFQMNETIRLHQHVSKGKASVIAMDMLEQVGIPSPQRQMCVYPHQLSGGMRQRVMIAMALSTHPSLLIADEPTTALDVTIQAQILELLKKIRKHTPIILITHDLGVVANMCDRVAVMYAGKVVEQGPLRDVLSHPLHPYTQGLIDSIPRLDRDVQKLNVIEGMVPDLIQETKGCSFCDRCKQARPQCAQNIPESIQMNGRSVRCFLYS